MRNGGWDETLVWRTFLGAELIFVAFDFGEPVPISVDNSILSELKLMLLRGLFSTVAGGAEEESMFIGPPRGRATTIEDGVPLLSASSGKTPPW